MATAGQSQYDIYWTRTWNRQKVPWRPPLPMSFHYKETVRRINYSATVDNAVSWPVAGDFSADAYNKAYARFRDKAYGAVPGDTDGMTAGWGVNLAQRKQAVDMIRYRALQLVEFSRRLKRFDFAGAYRAIGATYRDGVLSVPKRGSRKVKHSKKRSFANNFLEAHFGWEPILGDLHSSMNILQRDFDLQRVRATATVTGTRRETGAYGYSEWKFTNRCLIQAEFYLTNPNALLLEQLGLTNPLLVAWDVVPWSFVLGWFGNFEQCLQRYTDFTGMGFRNQFYTHSRPYTYDLVVPSIGRFFTAACYYQNRVVGNIPAPTFQWKVALPSVSRGLTAISLLLQQLPRR